MRWSWSPATPEPWLRWRAWSWPTTTPPARRWQRSRPEIRSGGCSCCWTACAGSSGESRDALRKVMVGVFADLGQDHPLALRYRRELASALF